MPYERTNVRRNVKKTRLIWHEQINIRKKVWEDKINTLQENQRMEKR